MENINSSKCQGNRPKKFTKKKNKKTNNRKINFQINALLSADNWHDNQSIDLVNSVIIFLSQITLLRWLTFLLRSQTVILIVLLFWIYFFLLTLVFVLQWLSLHWEILIMLLSQFPLTFHQIHKGIPCFIAQPMTILVLIGMVFFII